MALSGHERGVLVMAGGLAVPKELATDRLAPRFQAAGFSVLAIYFRRLGESGGTPRLVPRAADQQADLPAAITFARTLPEVDPERVALWGFFLSGGPVFPVAADEPRLGAAIALAPMADGPAATPNALRFLTPLAALRPSARAVLDVLAHLLGRDPVLPRMRGVASGSGHALVRDDQRASGDELQPRVLPRECDRQRRRRWLSSFRVEEPERLGHATPVVS